MFCSAKDLEVETDRVLVQVKKNLISRGEVEESKKRRRRGEERKNFSPPPLPLARASSLSLSIAFMMEASGLHFC